jgi:stage II sporulation protein D
MNTPRPTSPRTQAAPPTLRRAGRRYRRTLAGVVAAFVLLIAAGPAAAYTSQYEFTINGHGWGHGIGMSQWGAYGYAKHGWKYKAILRHYYTGISFSNVADSVIRVRLRSGLGSVKVSCPKDYTVKGTGAAATIPAGELSKARRRSGSPLRSAAVRFSISRPVIRRTRWKPKRGFW